MARFTAGEIEVMRILWEHGELKPAELQKLFPRPIKDAALRSYLTILVDKGHLRRRSKGKAFYYRPKTKSRIDLPFDARRVDQYVLRGLQRGPVVPPAGQREALHRRAARAAANGPRSGRRIGKTPAGIEENEVMNRLLTASGLLHSLVGAPVWGVLLLKITAVLSAAWLAHVALKRANPRWRVFLWRVAAVGLIALPAVALFLPAPPIRVRPPDDAAIVVPPGADAADQAATDRADGPARRRSGAARCGLVGASHRAVCQRADRAGEICWRPARPQRSSRKSWTAGADLAGAADGRMAGRGCGPCLALVDRAISDPAGGRPCRAPATADPR